MSESYNAGEKVWLKQLALQLSLVGADLGIRWGWKQDSKTVFGGRFSDFSRPSWVLYVDIPLGDGKTGQVSFHSSGPSPRVVQVQQRAAPVRSTPAPR